MNNSGYIQKLLNSNRKLKVTKEMVISLFNRKYEWPVKFKKGWSPDWACGLCSSPGWSLELVIIFYWLTPPFNGSDITTNREPNLSPNLLHVKKISLELIVSTSHSYQKYITAAEVSNPKD